MEKADYGSYVPRGLVLTPLILGVGALASSRWVKKAAYKVLLRISGGVSLLGSLTMGYVAAFYSDDRKLETRDALLELLPWKGGGKALDIGTGSGLLAVGLAKKFPEAKVVGVDIWKAWSGGMSNGLAGKNAAAEGVTGRVLFEKGDAKRLPFEDTSFDAVVTNLVWHNIPVKDRFELMREALRVLKPGGAFMFSDLFKRRSTYGNFDNLTERLGKEVSSLEVKEPSEVTGLQLDLFSQRWACVFYGMK